MSFFSRKDITVPNVLTCFRISLAAAAGLLFYLHRLESLAACLCIAAASLDYFDGWYARRYRQTTALGAHLDPFADKVLIAVIFMPLIFALRWPLFTFCAVIVFARETTITIFRMVRRRRSGMFTPASYLGKVKTTVQYLVGGFLLLYVYVHPRTVPRQTHLISALIIVTLFITVDSGVRYVLPRCADGKKRSGLERLGQWLFKVSAKEY